MSTWNNGVLRHDTWKETQVREKQDREKRKEAESRTTGKMCISLSYPYSSCHCPASRPDQLEACLSKPCICLGHGRLSERLPSAFCFSLLPCSLQWKSYRGCWAFLLLFFSFFTKVEPLSIGLGKRTSTAVAASCNLDTPGGISRTLLLSVKTFSLTAAY